MATLDELSATTRDAFVGFNEELLKMEYAAANIFLDKANIKAKVCGIFFYHNY